MNTPINITEYKLKIAMEPYIDHLSTIHLVVGRKGTALRMTTRNSARLAKKAMKAWK
jgi:hypothetical protein